MKKCFQTFKNTNKMLPLNKRLKINNMKKISLKKMNSIIIIERAIYSKISI